MMKDFKKINNKKIITLIAAITVLCLLCAGFLFFDFKDKAPTPVHKQVQKFMDDETIAFDLSKYSEDSSEALFLRGMEYYQKYDYENALTFFEKAINGSPSDKAVPVFARYYYNNSMLGLGNSVDFQYCKDIVSLMADYPPLRGDSDFLWQALIAVSPSPEADLEIITLLKDYISDTEGLTKEDIIAFENDLAAMYYFTEDYAQALKGFYKVKLTIGDNNKSQRMISESLMANNYIGNITYNYGDYETAIEYYENCLHKTVEDLHKNAIQKYVAAVNLPSSYYEAKQYDKAKKSVSYANDIIPYLDPQVALGVEAAINDVLARIAVEEKDFDECERLISENTEILGKLTSEIFYGMDIRHEFTKACLYSSQGKTHEALDILEKIADEDFENASATLGYDFSALLLNLYDKTGNYEKYKDISQQQLSANKDYLHELEHSYLDLGWYNAKADKFEEENISLSFINRTVIVICIIAFLLLILITRIFTLVRHSSLTDQLTGLGNRKMLNILAKKEGKRLLKDSLCMLMIDIDFFKGYNDANGHLNGDDALRKVADILKRSVRSEDTVIRFGGEEFLIILRNIEIDLARDVYQRINSAIENAAIPHPSSSVSDHLTLSIGLCYKEKDRNTTVFDMISKADEALYISKTNGRNRMSELFID